MAWSKGACFLVFCGMLTTNPLAAPPRTAPDRILRVSQDGILTLSEAGPAVLEGVVYPDGYLATRWLSRRLAAPVTVRTLGRDRYGRRRILAFAGGGTVQEAMLRDGAALAYDHDSLPQMPQFLAAEKEARSHRRGIWAGRDLVLSPAEAGDHRGEFHLVQGVVRRIYVGKSATDLNFGEDWHSDFSARIAGRSRRAFAIENLAGKTVRVRGLIEEENGPMIRLDRPEQLEVP